MAGNPFNKVQSGQALDIPAAAYNAMIDAALANRQDQGNISAALKGSPKITGIVSVRNLTGIALDRFAR